MKLIQFSLLLVISVHCFAQPLNKESMSIQCKNYELNPKKIKMKFAAEFATFQLSEVQVDIAEPIMMRAKGCTDKLEVVSQHGDLAKSLEQEIVSSYPKVKSLNMKLYVKGLKILYNNLPTSNPRLYMTVDFYLENPEKEYVLTYSTTKFLPIVKYIEKPLGRLLKMTIEDFHREKRYRNPFSLTETNDGQVSKDLIKGVYTSFLELEERKPMYQFDFQVKSNSSEDLRSKYFLTDESGEKTISNSVLCFNDGKKSYLNVSYYYPKRYFVELSSLNEDYYFIYDQIYDYTQAARNTAAVGGGLIGALAGSAAASKKSPGLISKRTGRLTTLSKKDVKDILTDQSLYDTYQIIIEHEDRKNLMSLLLRMLENKNFESRLLQEK